MILSKARLAITLSQLRPFENPDATAEQYDMDSEIGAEMLWNAHMMGDVEGKRIIDLGAGTGMLGIGALLLGAAQVTFVEQDPGAVGILKKNLSAFAEGQNGVVAQQDLESFDQHADVVVQNPPFGTREKHADRKFLKKAFSIAPIVYSFHKSTSAEFLEAYSADHGFRIAGNWQFEFPIKMSQLFHRKNIHRIKVGCWKFVKMPQAQIQPITNTGEEIKEYAEQLTKD